jgi:adenylate cyclase
MDEAQFEAAGLYDPKAPNAAERLEALRWLAAQGTTMEQMVDALRRGVLLGAAADLALRPTPTLTAEDVAARIEATADRVREISLAAGLSPGAAGQCAFTESDADTFRALIGGAAFLGPAATKRLARTAGSGLAQIAEAAVALYLVAAEAPMRAANATELAFAQHNLLAIRSLDALDVALRGLFRAHLATAIRRQRSAQRQQSIDSLDLTVGFVDLVGFTMLSRRMSNRELAEVIDRFEESAHDVVAAHDGRLVKLIGDEMMFVCVDASAACDIALTIIERFRGDQAVMPRGALASGELLFRSGDYYGPIVNLAARLTDLAVPHEVLVTPEVASRATAPALRFEPAGKRMLKGFDAPVDVLTVARRERVG